MSTNSKIILGVLGAAAAGVAIGLLLAPEKGTEMRKKLADTAEGWADHLTDLFANAKGDIENLTKKGSKAASDAASTISNARESYS
jgi:gas vesicle protein